MRNIYILDYIKSLLLCDKDATGEEKFTVHPTVKTGFGKSAWIVMTGKDVTVLKNWQKKKAAPPKKEKKKAPTKKSWTDNSQKNKSKVMYIFKICQISQ